VRIENIKGRKISLVLSTGHGVSGTVFSWETLLVLETSTGKLIIQPSHIVSCLLPIEKEETPKSPEPPRSSPITHEDRISQEVASRERLQKSELDIIRQNIRSAQLKVPEENYGYPSTLQRPPKFDKDT